MGVKPGYKQTEVGVIPEDWGIVSIGELCKCFSGGTPSTSNPRYYDGAIPWITSSDLNKGRITEVEGRISSDGLIHSAAKMVDKRTLLLALYGATAGVCAVTEIRAAINQAVLAIFPIRTNTEYLFQLLRLKRDFHIKMYTQGGQPNLSGEIVKSFLIPIPPTLAEQSAIATALSDADALIQSLERLIAKKRDIKQGAMQELLTGKKRLPGFEEMKGYKQTEVGVIPADWGIIKLNNIVSNFVNGGTPSTKNKDYWNGNIPWITGADIINQCVGEIRRHITKDAVRNSSTNVIQKGNLLIVSRTGVGKLAITPFDIAISQDFTGIYMDASQASTKYIYRFFDYHQSLLKKEIQGTSIKGITRDTLAEIQIPVPTLAEQSAIATVLSDMDAEIAALDSKLTKARQIKQGMMQELLTGRIRLVCENQ